MMDDGNLKPDGERFLPQFQGIIELEHYHRYFLAATLAKGKDVLDIASGEGFGSEILSRVAKSVVGVDISKDAVDHASKNYVRKNLRFLHGSATAIPVPDQSIDLIVSFETIEHLAEHDEMMFELKRVLRADGYLISSSPNKLVYTDRPNYSNPFHVRELYTSEFIQLSSRYFSNIRHYGQRVTTGSIIASAEATGSFQTFAPGLEASGVPDQMYDIILASDAALPDLGSSLFEQPHGPLQPQKMEAAIKAYAAKDMEVDVLRNELAQLIQEKSAKELAAEELKVELAKAVETKDTIVTGLAAQNQTLSEQFEMYRAAFYTALRDGQKILEDKWWRRTKRLRKLSNSIRKRKGKEPRIWPTNFEPDRYLAVAHNNIQKPAEQQLVPADGYDPTIPRVAYSDVSEGFVPYNPPPPIDPNLRAIAFYLPQFHPFPENDAWWGKGFTEWTNVGKAEPVFSGHHQPHCPIHFGYYDLRVPEVMEEQARLAKQYGVNGFAYYFYWFAGKVLMDLPLQAMLKNDKVDIPFCMIWANENWSRRWDGMDQDVLIAQEHSLEDSRAMLDHLKPFMEDSRYIKIHGKPLFVIYRADIIPDIAETIEMWRSRAVEFGFPGLYVVCAQTFGHRDPRRFGFDAAMEFPPRTVKSNVISDRMPNLDPAFSGTIFSYDQVVTNAVKQGSEDFKVFPTSMLSWDNTARKKKKGHIFADFSLTRYAQWLSANAERVMTDERLSADEKIIFINAWNEWAEGTHLEPDQKHGYAYLDATSSVLRNYSREAASFLPVVQANAARSDIAVIAHLHYAATWPDLRESIQKIYGRRPDLYVTVTSLDLAKLVSADFPEAAVEIIDNRGRDIRPFLHVLRKIQPLGYKAVAKVHGKASVYRADGDQLRKSSLESIMTESSLDTFLGDELLGILAPLADLIAHSDKNMTHNALNIQEISDQLGLTFTRGQFPAGSMFWFRPKALSLLLQLSLDDFDVERGLADGTRAHAIERLFGVVCEAAGYKVQAT